MKRTIFNKYCIFRLPSSADSDVGKPYWTDDDIDAMDRAFCEQMHQAIAAGLESPPKGVNTTPGTRRPIVNYRRSD
jgi:hypothetical protein